ncbi:MAG: hypothetical protein WD114_05410 [Phycisphaerales bacterium]
MKTQRTTSRIVLAAAPLLAAALLTPLGGCQLFNEQVAAEPGPAYPETLPQGEVFDIQVFRDVTTLRFTNTTTRDFGPGVVWLNKRYSLPIDGFASGETVELDLTAFVDEFGDTYRAGGFFAQREPAPVVLVQLETTDNTGEDAADLMLYGMVIVENKYN